MEIKELKNNQPLEVLEVCTHVEADSAQKTLEFKPVQTLIFTDGEVVGQSEEITGNISLFNTGEREYKADTLKTKKIYISGHSYIIKCLIADELSNITLRFGLVKVLKDVSIYLENQNNKESLRNAKQVIKLIKKYNSPTKRMGNSLYIPNSQFEETSKMVYVAKKH